MESFKSLFVQPDPQAQVCRPSSLVTLIILLAAAVNVKRIPPVQLALFFPFVESADRLWEI
jgi:hypothetical protein